MVNNLKMKLKTIFLLIFLGIVISSCYKDNEEYLYGADCQTENISFSESIKPILDNQCLACHSDAAASSLGGNVFLDGYDNVLIKVNDSALYGALSHQDGYSPMPQNAPQLNECSISLIEIWINEGAKNN